MNVDSRVYVGVVRHRRLRPAVHALRYRVFSVLLYLDEIDALARSTRGFSRNRFDWTAFHDRDFGCSAGSRTETTLERYVESALADAGIAERPARIAISCYPRVLGYAFNPLTLFYCERGDGSVYAVVHEVHNTFGERHAYALPVAPEAVVGEPYRTIEQRADKVMHVSPFATMDLHYRFRLNRPGRRQVIAIDVHDDNGRLLTATYVAEARPFTAAELARQSLRLPLMTLKVTAGIHVEAFRLWRKRVPWYRHRPKSTELV